MLTEQVLVKRAEKSVLELAAIIKDDTAPEELRKRSWEVFEALVDDLSDPRLQKSVDPRILQFGKSVIKLTKAN